MRIAVAGMTHLGFTMAVAAAARQIDVVCYDSNQFPDDALLASEPGLAEQYLENRSFITKKHIAEKLAPCDLCFIGRDVNGPDDLAALRMLIGEIIASFPTEIPLIVMSQVPPGFTRQWAVTRANVYHQVDTLITKKAMQCALYPARLIIGCAEPERDLPPSYRAFIAKAWPHLPEDKVARMGFESAEMAKIAVNVQLAASIAAANALRDAARHVGAEWADVEKALRLDPRIGETAYVRPGRIGGHLPRDVRRTQTIALRADEADVDAALSRMFLGAIAQQFDLDAA